jgi:hypothetical protein
MSGRLRNGRRGPAGKVASKPTPGWKPRAVRPGFVNPRPPSVPNTMDLRLDEYFAGAALIGVLASQGEEPDTEWACKWAWEMGHKMAHRAVARRNGRKR